MTWEGDRTIVRCLPAVSRSSATEQVYGHKYISYDILIVDITELNAYISIKLNKPKEKQMDNEYKDGWRFIVWVGGVDDYYKNFVIAQMHYHNWIAKGYDNVVMTEINKDGTEKVLMKSEEVA